MSRSEKIIFHKVSKYLVNHFGKKSLFENIMSSFFFSPFFLVESILRKEILGDELHTGKYLVVMMFTILPWYKDLTKTRPLLFIKNIYHFMGKIGIGFYHKPKHG